MDGVGYLVVSFGSLQHSYLLTFSSLYVFLTDLNTDTYSLAAKINWADIL